MTAIQKRIVIDENGQPMEVIISWDEFCELNEAFGLDLDAEAIADLRETKRDWESGDKSAFIPISEI